MTRADLILVLNTLRNLQPLKQEEVAEWAQAIEVVARELVNAVEADHADR